MNKRLPNFEQADHLMDVWMDGFFHMNKIPRANKSREESLVSARRHSVSTFVDNWLG